MLSIFIMLTNTDHISLFIYCIFSETVNIPAKQTDQKA